MIKNDSNELLTRGVEEIFIRKDLEAKLTSGKKLRVKFGIDPTSPFIHLGRAVPLRKLKAFQDLGHNVVLIMGDFTAKIGDPSDKLEKRPMLTAKEIKSNLKNYLKQIGLILNMKKVEIHYNSEWFAKMDLLEIGKLLECFTVQQMGKRRNFKERLDAGTDVFLVEFMYPALQGYDSVEVKADVEIGGFDQLFNLKAGRIVQRRYGQAEQDIMTLSMIEGTDGRKMSSSWGNIIGITDSPDEMFGKVMSLRDDLILKYFLLCTDLPMLTIEGYARDMAEGANPRDLKMILGKELVALYHSKKSADKAQESFIAKFKNKEIPDDAPKIKSNKGELLVDVFMKNKIIASKNEFRRLVDEGAITNLDTNKKIKEYTAQAENGVYRIGKKRFCNIKLS